MQQVKFFKTVETEVSELEKEINAWLQETGATIISITGNVAPQTASHEGKALGIGSSQFSASDILVIVLYETASA